MRATRFPGHGRSSPHSPGDGLAVAPGHTAPVASRAHDPTFVLVHSPLVGPTSWLPVAQELERRGRAAVVPTLLGVAEAPAPQWRHVPDAMRAATSDLQEPIVLVGHSGAGLLLPVIADALNVEVAGLVFVDSFLPPSAGRLVLGPPAFIDHLRAMATDRVLAPWSSWFGEDAMPRRPAPPRAVDPVRSQQLSAGTRASR